jgi:hypothetical protein
VDRVIIYSFFVEASLALAGTRGVLQQAVHAGEAGGLAGTMLAMFRKTQARGSRLGDGFGGTVRA